MKKIVEMEAWELMSALAELAEPVSNLVSDDVLWEQFKKCTARGMRLRRKDGLQFILETYGKLGKPLLGEHKDDTLKILSVVTGKKFDELMHMNGVEVVQEFSKAYKEQLAPFFTKSVPSEKTESSSQ